MKKDQLTFTVDQMAQQYCRTLYPMATEWTFSTAHQTCWRKGHILGLKTSLEKLQNRVSDHSRIKLEDNNIKTLESMIRGSFRPFSWTKEMITWENSKEKKLNFLKTS